MRGMRVIIGEGGADMYNFKNYISKDIFEFVFNSFSQKSKFRWSGKIKLLNRMQTKVRKYDIKKPGNCNIFNFLHFCESINRTRPILFVEGAFDDPEE